MNQPSAEDPIALNRASWDERVPIHVASGFYANDAFKAGRLSIPQMDIDEVGDVRGRTLLHLQCHFGQDTLSWARLGARVTGLDFSQPAIDAATDLAREIGIADARFVCAEVYEAREALAGERFDVVYTGAGALLWLPDIWRWAEVVADSLVPGGTFYIREGHPVKGLFDNESSEPTLRLAQPYFRDGPDRWDEPGTYAEPTADTTNNVTYEWSHNLGDIVTALARAGLHIESLRELDEDAWQAFPSMVEAEPGRYRLPTALEGAIPLMYTLCATKPA